MKYIVYCTTCLENGKIYIGVHKTENENIFDGYIGNGISVGFLIKNPKTAFQYAIKKYGYSKFKRSILYVFDNEEDAYKKESEIVTLDFIKRRDNYNIKLGGKNGSYFRKKIFRYKLSGEFWEEYLGFEEICDKFGCCTLSIRSACEKNRSFKNSYWSYSKVDKLNLNLYSLSRFSTIYQFDDNGNIIKEWNNTKDICRELNITQSNILSALNKKTKAKGFYFSRNDNIINILKSKNVYNSLPKLKCGEKRKIAQYDLSNNLIKIWPSIKECAMHFSKCRDVAKGLRKSTKGYIFKYLN